MTETDDRLKQTHDAALAAIREMVAALDDDREDALQRIHDDPLSLDVRTPWHPPGAPEGCPDAYRILLATAGPAVRLTGRLDDRGAPETATLDVQDWFTPATTFGTADADDAALLLYAGCFTHCA